MAEVRPARLVGFDSFVQERDEGGLKFFRGFVEADDVLVVHLHRFEEFHAKRFNSHN